MNLERFSSAVDSAVSSQILLLFFPVLFNISMLASPGRSSLVTAMISLFVSLALVACANGAAQPDVTARALLHQLDKREEQIRGSTWWVPTLIEGTSLSCESN